MNNVIRENNQLLGDKQKYELSLFAVQILASTKKNMSYWFICLSGPIPHLFKNGIVHFNLNLMNTLDFLEKKSKYMANINAHAIFFIINTVPSNARLNPNFKMTIDKSHNASLTLK